MSALKGPRFAPEDPTLPKPWRALIDGNTGYMYFWNPVTKVTQYQKPCDSDVCATSEAKSANTDVSSNDDQKENEKDDVAKVEGKKCDLHVEESKDSTDKHGLSKVDTRTSAEEPMNTDDLSASGEHLLTHGSSPINNNGTSNTDAPAPIEDPIDNHGLPDVDIPVSIKESPNNQEKPVAGTPGSTVEPAKNQESPKLNNSAAEESFNNHGLSNVNTQTYTEKPSNSPNNQEKPVASTPGSTVEPAKNQESPKLNTSAAEESFNNHGSSNMNTQTSTEKPSNGNKTSNVGARAYVEDPTLPKPWRAITDRKTGYMYFWNPETKVTQYQRPNPVVNDNIHNISQTPSDFNRSFVSEKRQREQDQDDYSSMGSEEQVKDDLAKVEETKCHLHVEESKECTGKHGLSKVDTHTSAEEPINTDDLSASGEHLLTYGSLPINNDGTSNTDALAPMEHPLDNHGLSDVDTPVSIKECPNSQEKPVASTPGSTVEPAKNQESPKSNTSAAEESFNNHGSSSVNTQASTEKPSNVNKSSNVSTRAYVEDPTLPKPWRAIIDRNTGYMYFWNPETKVTQYQRPNPVINDGTHNISQMPSDFNRSFVSGKRQREQDQDDYNSMGSEEQVKGDMVNVRESRHVQEINEEPFKNQGPTNVCTPAEAEAYRRQHEIKVTGNVPHPFTTFESTGFPSELLREILRAGFKAPTPIQAQSWPIAMQNRDIVAVAKTGSGKTLGYLIPAFIHLQRLQNDSKAGPRVLVLSPTRELATQIHDEAEKFGISSRISAVCLYGGAPKGPQLRDLDRGADVVIATPGRLNDILEMKRVSLHQISYLVLDEADRMLDMGFEPQIRKILSAVQPRRQTLMFTATWPKEVRKIASEFLNNPVQVNIGNIDELVANKSITQYVEVISSMEKRRRLEQIIRSQEPGSKIIVFCATKRMCDQIARTLAGQYGAAAIHGDKSQTERDSILSHFRTGASPVLVATDVAARGLDVKDIRVVVNYDFPTGIEDYVHRIGRTGRAGSTGEAYTFFSDQDARYASELVKILEGANQKVPQELRQLVSRGGSYGGGYSKFRRTDGGSGGGSFGSGGGRGYNSGGGGGGWSSGGGSGGGWSSGGW